MKTDPRVLYRALEELTSDVEFAGRLAVASDGSRLLVSYLTRRGVDEIDGELLGLAYFAGRIHQEERINFLLTRVMKAS